MNNLNKQELETIAEGIIGKECQVKKPRFKRLYIAKEKGKFMRKIRGSKLSRPIKTGTAALIIAASSIPVQSTLDIILQNLLPKYSLVSTAEAAKPEVEFQFNEKDAIALSSSVVINGLLGGLGAHFKLSPNSKIRTDSNFWKGFQQGMVGGAFTYAGMKTMTFQNEWDYSILTGKQISDLGTSITHSAAMGEDWLKNPRYMTDFGPFVLNWEKEKGLKPEMLILPGSAICTGYALARHKLNIKQTTKTGLLIFDGYMGDSEEYSEDHRQGVHMANIAVIPAEETDLDHKPSHNYNITLAHEAIHSRQYIGWMPLDILIDSKLNEMSGRNPKVGLLKYSSHNFRFGPDVGGMAWTGIGDLSQIMGVPYHYKNNEFASFNLFNFENY